MFTTTCIRPKYVFSIIWRLALLSSTACHYCGSVMSQTKKQIKTWILPWLSRARDVSITFFTVVFFAQLLDDVVKCYLFSFFIFRPVNFLHSFSYSNRFTIAVTFGATASSCLGLFFSFATGEFASSGVSVWLEGEEMLSFIQNISYFKTCLSRSMYSSRPHNICLFPEQLLHYPCQTLRCFLRLWTAKGAERPGRRLSLFLSIGKIWVTSVEVGRHLPNLVSASWLWRISREIKLKANQKRRNSLNEYWLNNCQLQPRTKRVTKNHLFFQSFWQKNGNRHQINSRFAHPPPPPPPLIQCCLGWR